MAGMVKTGMVKTGKGGRGPDDIRSDNGSNVINVDSPVSGPVGGGPVDGVRKRARAAPQSAEELAARNKAYFLEAVTVSFIWQAMNDYNKSEVICSCFSCHANGFG